ncbi:MAG: DegT/DnrJ/EryC1/StrS family aminotransferase [Candidatus Omnitrophota bacterium]
MSLIREIPPTAGWPLTIKSLVTSLFKKYPPGLLEDDFKKYLTAPQAKLTYSGTSALYIILESIKKLSNKKTVIIPAFICPLMPLAIKKAGLKIKVCDTNAHNFDFDKNKLENICSSNNDILAILAVHLGGLAIDFSALKEIAQKYKAFIIEDCAQSLGSQYYGRKTGTLGEFSFFSLCRGKGLTIYEGGIAATNLPEYANILNDTARDIMHPNFLSESLKIAELFAYSIFYQPNLFWFAFRLPQLFWQLRNNPTRAMGEYFKTNFPIHQVSAFREYIGHINFSRLEEKIKAQRKKVDIYLEGLKNIPGVHPIVELRHTQASYPYLTLIFEDAQKRNSKLNLLKNSGLGISQVYLQAITDYAYLKNTIPDAQCPNSRKLSKTTITLSTSEFLKGSDLKNIISKFN